MLHLICNILRIFIHTVHTGEEPYIYGFTIVSLINKPGSQVKNNPCQTYCLKSAVLVTENSWLQRYC